MKLENRTENRWWTCFLALLIAILLVYIVDFYGGVWASVFVAALLMIEFYTKYGEHDYKPLQIEYKKSDSEI